MPTSSKEQKQKSLTCDGCSNCQKQKVALWRAINNALLVIEMFEEVMEAVRGYDLAIEKWRKSHSNLPPVSEVLNKCPTKG